MKSAEFSVTDVCGDACVSADAGDKLYARIRESLPGNIAVFVDFAGVRCMTSTFANRSIGRLCGDLGDDFRRVNFRNLDPFDRELMDLVIGNARRWYAEKRAQGA